MPCAIPLGPSPSREAELSLPRAREISSILSSLPFFPDHDQEEAIEIQNSLSGGKEGRWKASSKLDDSVRGITSRTSWHGTRADEARAGGRNIDYAMLLSGKVRRLTARIPVGLEIGGYRTRYETAKGYLRENRLPLNAKWALLHAAERARYRIGEGLIEAACVLVDHDLLNEARIFYGDGRNTPERILVRDAVFASEDLTIEDMVGILISAPYKAGELFGDPIPVWEEDRAIDERTPLVFVHCAGITNDLKGNRDVVLEAVDFGTIETLTACASAIRKRDSETMREARDMLSGIMDDTSISNLTRRR